MKRKKFLFFLLLALLSALPIFFKSAANLDNKKHTVERYNETLAGITSLQMAQHYIDGEYAKLNLPVFDTVEYVRLATKFTKERFYHGVSYYGLSDNWVLYFGSKLFWSHISAIVDPEDILKHSEALCSQQTIVYMEILKRKKINVRSIGLGYKEGPGHFLAEVNYGTKWHLYDVTLEPEWKKVFSHHESIDYYLQRKDSLYLAYESVLTRPVFDKIMEKVVYGEVNQFPAKRMLLFHQTTKFIIYILPLAFLLLSFWFYKKGKA